MIKYILICMSVVFILGCIDDSRDGLPAGKRAGGISLKDSHQNELLIEKMEKSGIPYEVDDRGMINYLLKDYAEIQGFARQIQIGSVLDPNISDSAILFSDDSQIKYEKKFKEKGIPYTIRRHGGVQHIFWSLQHSPLVDIIQQEVEFEMRK